MPLTYLPTPHRLLIGLAFTLALGGETSAQQPAPRPRTVTITDDAGQRVAFALPTDWKLVGGVVHDARGRKIAEVQGTDSECTHKTGTGFIKELKAGYADDMGSPRFVGSRTLVLGKQTWTEGIRNVPLWDGKQNSGRWYTHSFFTVFGGRCFKATFFSTRPTLAEEGKVRQLLASIRLL